MSAFRSIRVRVAMGAVVVLGLLGLLAAGNGAFSEENQTDPSDDLGNRRSTQSRTFTVPQLIWFGPLFAFHADGAGGVVPFVQADYMNLFAAGAPWSRARNRIQVFEINEQLVSFESNDSVLETIFSYLNAHNIGLAMSVPPLIASAQCGQNVEGYTGSVADATR